MEETRIGILQAFINTFKAFNGNIEKADSPIEYEDLKQEDFKKAGISKEEQQELGMSLDKIKNVAVKFFNTMKIKTKKAISKYKEDSNIRQSVKSSKEITGIKEDREISE